MAYTTSTITSADPAQAFLDAIEAQFNLHDNWEFVEQVTIATINYRVWRNRGSGLANAAANNSFGSDFYIAMYRSSATDLRFKVFESWDAINKKVIRPCKNTSTLTPNANYSWGDEVNGYTLDSASLTYSNTGVALITTGFEYGISVTRNHMWVWTKISTMDCSMGFGIFESLVSGEPFPLYLSKDGNGFHNFAGGAFAWSRHPGIAIASNVNNFVGYGESLLGPRLGGVGDAENDRFHGGGILYAPFTVTAFGSPRSAYGWVRGKLYDTILLNSVGSSRVGDTCVVGGVTYVKFLCNSAAIAAIHPWINRDAV